MIPKILSPMFLPRLAIVLVTVFSSLMASAAAAPNYRQAAAESLKAYFDKHPEAAVVVGIVDSKGTHVFGFGKLKASDPKSKPDGKTIYQVGSVTKVFTTTMLAQDVLAGRMKLDVPAQQYLPAEFVIPKEQDREITLEDLATHHSGLPALPQLAIAVMIGGSLAKNPYAGLDHESLARLLPVTWLSKPIGSEYGYSNLGIGLIGEALVNVNHADSYDRLVEERITRPLDLVDTGVELDPEKTSRLAQGYDILGMKTPAWDFPALEGCGALYSTVDDLLVFAEANLGLKDTRLETAMKLAQETRPNYSIANGAIGLGWHHLKHHGIPMVWHNGATGGYTSMLALLPTKKMGIVILSNSGDFVDPCAYVLIDHIFSDSQKPFAE